jgi:retron-type reverse transcriptase
VIDVDLSRYFDTIRHSVLLDKIAQRVQDPEVLHLVKQSGGWRTASRQATSSLPTAAMQVIS